MGCYPAARAALAAPDLGLRRLEPAHRLLPRLGLARVLPRAWAEHAGPPLGSARRSQPMEPPLSVLLDTGVSSFGE